MTKANLLALFSRIFSHLFARRSAFCVVGRDFALLQPENQITYRIMKTRFWIVLIVIAVTFSAISLWVDAQQQDSRQQRREQREQMSAERRAERIKKREERIAAYIRHIDSIVLSRNFIFNPTSMQRQPAGQFISINNPSFEVAYYTDYIDVHIPFIKGVVPPYYPVVLNAILPSVSDYTTIQNTGGWTVTFSSWLYGGSDYIFTLEIYSASGSAVLTIKSLADNTVTYSGYISQVY